MVDTIYAEIAAKLAPVLPKNWEQVHLYAQLAEGTYEFFFYVRTGGTYIQCFDLDNEDAILDVFDELNDVLLPDWQEKKWTVCTYSLNRSGHVTVDYDYAELPEDMIAYKAAWEKKYLQ